MWDDIDRIKRTRRVLMAGGMPISFSDADYNRLWALAEMRQVPVSRFAAELIPEIAAGIDAVVGRWLDHKAAVEPATPTPAAGCGYGRGRRGGCR